LSVRSSAGNFSTTHNDELRLKSYLFFFPRDVSQADTLMVYRLTLYRQRPGTTTLYVNGKNTHIANRKI